jgi:hypothetical protein
MNIRRKNSCALSTAARHCTTALLFALLPTLAGAGPATDVLPEQVMFSSETGSAPVDNAAFAPAKDALAAPPFAARLRLDSQPCTSPVLTGPVLDGQTRASFV